MAPIDKMATIEPRLIHLLNDNPQGRDQLSRDLPSIASLPAPGVSKWHSLPPLESDTIPRLPLPPPLPSSSNSTQIPGLHEAGIDVSRPLLADNPYLNDGSQLISSARPLNLLLGEPHEAHTTTLSLRMLVDETTTDSLEDLATKKRHRAFTNKDDFAQLPQPLKKQKSTQQVMPPIIAGLNEPPPNPNASLFPPISGGFDDNDTLGLGASLKDFSNSVEDLVTAAAPLSDGDNKNNGVGSAKVKRRAAKPRRKWTEQETNALLLGVSKHGVGKWTSILEDPEFMFNERSAGDLKDRFRTCCPDELRGPSSTGPSGKKQRSSMTESNAGDQALYSQPPSANVAEESTVVTTASIPPPKSKSSLPLANILIEPEAANIPPAPPSSDQEIFYAYSYPHQHPDSDTTPGKQQRKSRAHRKKLEDLVALGIDGPFKKSRRRERRPFTEQDDKEILAGLERYGPAWTKIQRDTEYHLSSRQPTDLRDRVRNKYPDVYANMEHLNVKEGKAAGLLEPSINTVIERPTYNLPSNDLHNQSSFEDMVERAKHGELNRSTSKEEMSIGGKGPGPGASLGTHMAHSDMDISRLLLDDSAQSTAAPRLPLRQSSGPGVGSHINQHYPYPQPHPARSGSGGGGTGVPPYNNMASDRRYGTGR